ncbi:MAG: hypothetical protein FWG32_00530 [Oscillospiraceae bacterium]|nr:hypothetical protein [Oscillospiraceae bacterium]
MFLPAVLFLLSAVACGSSGTPKNTALPDKSPSETERPSAGEAAPVETPKNDPITTETPARETPDGYDDRYNESLQGPAYFFIDGMLMGAFENGEFLSRYDKYCTYGDRDFTYGEFLSQPYYDLYSQSEYLGRSTEVKIDSFPGLDTPLSEEDAKLLGQFATEEIDSKNIYKLPVAFSGNANKIPYPRYNGYIHFGNGILATNARHDPLPRIVTKTEEITERDLELIRKELELSGIPGATPNVSEVWVCDLKNDGISERIITARAPRDERGYLLLTEDELKNGDSGNYTMVLIDDGINACCIFKKTNYYSDMPILPDISLPWNVEYYLTGSSWVAGIFDLNGDGSFEICIYWISWDVGSYKVYSMNDTGKYEQVLESFFGG